MTAFLFDENHKDLESFFGIQCARIIIEAIEEMDYFPISMFLRGSLLHARYCYELEEVTLRSNNKDNKFIASLSSSQKYMPNLDHYRTVVCDLAETMCCSGSSIAEEDLQMALARKNIWAIVLPNLADKHLEIIAERLRPFSPFLGWVKIDWDNPIHKDIFFNSLFQDMLISSNGIYKKTEWEAGSEDGEDEKALLREYGSKYCPNLIDQDEFLKLAPQQIVKSSVSKRAELSMQRVRGADAGHRSKIGSALANNYESKGSFRKFSAVRPDDGIEFLVPEMKLTKYLLDLDHPKGGGKARFFKNSLDIIKDDWRFLADQLCQAASNSDFYRLDVTEYGVMHGAEILISGRNGRQAVIETGWKLGEKGPAQFVTAYPGDESKSTHLQCFPGRVPSTNCTAAERWKLIHEMAHASGVAKGEGKIPSPMVLEKWGTIWDGACGFGWVFLPDARTPFSRWAIKSEIGYAARPGVCILSKLQTQSVEKNLAYALGYAEVLRANGIECSAKSRLD